MTISQLHEHFMLCRAPSSGARTYAKPPQPARKSYKLFSVQGHASLKPALTLTISSRPLPPMSRTDNDEEAFRNTMTGLPHRSSSTQAHASSQRIPPANPSASILLISPTNRILLLHRVRTSTSFASAHVFPGGHLAIQDGYLPPRSDIRRHEDSEAYRRAAIRECFEESGLLLARRQDKPSELVELSMQEREGGRIAVHSESILFADWVQTKRGTIDVDGLVPFTRWLTPANIPKRFSTQMYLYFLPIDSELSSQTDKTQMHIPTPDGGVEHTAAQFLYPQEWLDLSLSGDIVLYPPQFFLLHLIAAYLKPSPSSKDDVPTSELQSQREKLLHFVRTDGDPPWGEKCISPNPIKKIENGKYLIMGMADVGPELEGTHRRGDAERVLKVALTDDIERGRKRPSPQEVLWRKDMLHEEDGSKL
ncbi:hypothetical protein N7G274_005289 [Stereocaulon virgatum]|uniref:Nudix hydrolase domain-containing protein n=1 Tax=Stereocaulon virgatum TaxID=373712 RepID=A0ABR4A9K0_9LECA